MLLPVVQEGMSTTTIIIQARTGSKRMPNKVLAPFKGANVLWHVIKRCDLTGFRVVVAIPDGDSALESWLQKNEVLYHAGSEDDLTRRYLSTATFYDANPIVRITADCPLINVELIKLTVRLFELQGNKGYIGCHLLRGLNVEVFDYETLEKAANNGPDEHCTTWMRKQPWARDFPELELNTEEDYMRLLQL